MLLLHHDHDGKPCVALQLVMFGNARTSHVDFLEKSNVAFKHLFLRDWNAAYETMPYPPAMGAFAVYTIPKFYDMLDFALNQVFVCILC